MKHIRLLVVGLLLGAALAGCGSSDDSPPAPPPPPPPPQPVDFTAFVKDRFDATDDTSDPVEVDGTEFSFDDQDNPDAFDDLLDDQ